MSTGLLSLTLYLSSSSAAARVLSCKRHHLEIHSLRKALYSRAPALSTKLPQACRKTSHRFSHTPLAYRSVHISSPNRFP